MRKDLLLDSHIVLWALTEDPELPDRTWEIISAATAVYVSAATCWELEIKKSLGKLEFSGDLLRDVERTGFSWLPITPLHAHNAARLPLHHRDPFDRMLIAQATTENLELISCDGAFTAYGIHVINGPG